jgi:phosphoribosylamine--glycine ligase
VLVVGGGGREHALAWACSRSPLVSRVSCAPGNPGTGRLGVNWAISATDTLAITIRAKAECVDLVVLGPDSSVAVGLADALAEAGIPCFGPTRAAGQVETSKVFAKRLMTKIGIRTPPFVVCQDPKDALWHLRHHEAPVVVKADGLALGKGVFVCDTNAEAEQRIDELLVRGELGEAGRTVLIEDRIEGPEISFFALCDGERSVMLPPACDYKRALDGDQGGNTGGMGSYSPPQVESLHKLQDHAQWEIVSPLLAELRRMGRPFRGCLYVGGILVDRQINVLEFNARFGDPEVEVLLPRLPDPVPYLLAAATGILELPAPEPLAPASLGVVAVRKPYPAPVTPGGLISGLEEAEEDGCIVFHMGTRLAPGGGVEVAGGRVFILVATGEDLGSARQRAYSAMERISFPEMRYRFDIGA